MIIKSNKFKTAAGVFLIISLMVIPSWLWFHFNGISLSPEAMDCAQLARNITRGNGFTTDFIRPASLIFIERISGHPDLYNPPLYSWLLSMAFRIAGSSDKVMILFSLSLFWLTGILIVILARVIFNSLTALLSAVIYFTNAILLNSVLKGSPVLLESLLFVGLVYLLYNRKQNYLSYGLIGLFCGVAYLSSYIWLWFLAPVIIYLFLTSGGLTGGKLNFKTVAYFATGFVLVVIGWWWRNWQVTGNPFFDLGGSGYKMFTSLFPGSSLLRETTLQLFDRAPSLKQLLLKWVEGSELVYRQLIFFTGSFLSSFFWITLITPFKDRRWSRIRFFIFGCLLMGVCRYIIYGRRVDDLNLLIPVAILSGTAAFHMIWQKLPPSKKAIKRSLLVLFLGLNIFPFINQLQLTPLTASPTKSNLIRIGSQIAEGEVIISDLPWAAAWYGEMSSLWVPVRPDEVSELLAHFPMIKYIYLTPEIAEYSLPVSRIAWLGIYQTRNRSPFWTTGEIISLPGEQFFSRITRKNKEK